jgi:threonine synthase
MFYSLVPLQLKQNKSLVFSCLSEFGNICAGIIAKKWSLPLNILAASTNVNDTVQRFLRKQITIQNLPNQPFRMQWMLGIK